MKRLPPKICGHCGAKIVEYKFSLNKGMVACLTKLKNAGGIAHISTLGLTNAQYVTMHKLAWWGLIRKVQVDDEDGEGRKRGGTWSITKRGGRFLRGKKAVPKYLWTYRGKPVRTEKDLIFVSDVVDGYKYRREYAAEAMPRRLAQ